MFVNTASLVCTPRSQGLLFAYFSAVLAAEIRAARAEGKWSEGLADVAGSRIWREVRGAFRIFMLRDVPALSRISSRCGT